MASVTLEHVSKKFEGPSDYLAKKFGRGAGLVAPQEDEDGEVHLSTTVMALNDLSLEVKDGEAMAIVGPSGSGKSTLLRVVAGLEQANSGRVLFDGRDVTDLAPKDRGIGMVFQNYALYPHMESRMNLAFTFLVRKREKEVPERVRITSEIMGVGFEELLDRKPKELSGGQQQRVAIARCIVRDPSLFLLDEPLSNLDAKLRVRTRVEIKRLLRRFAITTLYVTHDQVEAIALGDRIAVMNLGRIEQVAPYREIYDRPVNVLVGTFIGIPPMNILPGFVSLELRTIRGSGWELPLPAGWAIPSSSQVLVGIRPEHVTISAQGANIPLSVEVVEPLIQERMQLVHGSVDGQRFTAKISAEDTVHVGDILPLAADLSQVHLFDATTRQRLPQTVTG